MEANGQTSSEIYPVDIALCIDGTASMTDIIEEAKSQALKFHADFKKAMEDEGKEPGKLRIRKIVFRDLKIGESMETTKFYSLPEEEKDFADEIKKIEAKGGGDEPENAVEALIEAIDSDWVIDQASKQRWVIVLWTDASAHKDNDVLTKFTSKWAELPEGKKRLVIFAPDAYPWKEISENLDNTIVYFSKAGTGLADVEYHEIMKTIAQSVGG